MKTIRTLRVLSLLGFLLLLAPFYDSCKQSETAPAESPVEGSTSVVAIDTIATKKVVVENDTINKEVIEKIPFYKKAIIFIDNGSLNAFDMAWISSALLESHPSEKFTYKDLCVSTISVSFVVIIIFSFLMLVFVFTKKTKLIHNFSIGNLILISITIIVFIFFERSFESYKQIKWGYYAFTIVQIAILLLSRTLYKNPNQSTMKILAPISE